MGALPSSMVTAVACSAAAGKNPWLPLSLIFLLAAPGSVPELMMDPDLHRQLHDLGPTPLLWSLGAIFGVMALLDSLADKIGIVEKWFVPVSTAWRPFAGVACAAIVGVAAARDAVEPETAEALRLAFTDTAAASLLVGGSVVAVTVTLGALTSWIATVSKTGTRLLLTMVPIPGLKLAHSFFDDFFALGATFGGFAFAGGALMPVLLGAYLLLGVITAPLLTRLTWIHVRIGLSLLRKARRSVAEDEPPPPPPSHPKWLTKWLEAEAATDARVLPSYVYRAPELGWCRLGFLVLREGSAAMVVRVGFRTRVYSIAPDMLARVGLAETSTARSITLVERLASGALREVHVHLFPAMADEILPLLERGAQQAGLVPVRADSESARGALPGWADRERSVRFLPAESAGSLRLQGLVSIAFAIALGVLTGGVFVPIGTGYAVSPFKRRFVLGWLVSGYLAACVVGTGGLAWPAAVLYASVLNVLTLRDLTRNAVKAHVEGFVDRRAWLPLVAGRVWVHRGAVRSDMDRDLGDAEALAADAPWRATVQLLTA